MSSGPTSGKARMNKGAKVGAVALAGLVATATAVYFFGGGSSSEQEGKSSPSTVVSSSESPASGKESDREEIRRLLYLTSVRVNDEGFFDDYTNSELIELGLSVCDRLSSGESVQSVSFDLVDQLRSSKSGRILGAAPGSFCPEHDKKVEDYLDSLV